MTNRATRMVPRIVVATALASAAIVTSQLHPATAADECITKPGEASAGKHWFYRSDRATKRQCWYLRDSDTTSHGASLDVRKSAAAKSHKAHAALSPSSANARAEWAPPATWKDDKNDDVKLTAAAGPEASPAAAASPAPAADLGAPAQPLPAVDAAAADQSTVATRWPGQTESAAPVAAAPPSAPFAVAAAAPSQNADAEPITPATAAQLSVGETASPAGSAVPRTDDPARTKLFLFLGAVAVAGFSSSVLLGRARRQRIRLEPAVASRATRWPAEPEIDRMRLPSVDEYYPAIVPVSDSPRRSRRPSLVPRDEEARPEQLEVEQILARYSGQARSEG
jgi:hypothetical protein